MFNSKAYSTARLAQSVEHGTLNPRVVGSSPTLGEFFLQWPKDNPLKQSNWFKMLNSKAYSSARLAQSVEHGTLNPRVVGSSPTLGEFFCNGQKTTN